jgi:hypothetical protein
VEIKHDSALNFIFRGQTGRIDKMLPPAHDTAMSTPTREEIDARLETIETRMDGRISTLEAKIDSKFADMKADIHKGTSELIKWVVGTAIAMAAVSLTVITFVLNNAVPKSPPVPAQQPAPIIIYAQPAPLPATAPAQAAPPTLAPK